MRSRTLIFRLRDSLISATGSLGLAILIAGEPIHADVSLPAIISDHMLLQKADNVPIWGTASSGEAVTVSLDGVTAGTRAGADGKWEVNLNLHNQSAGPFTMTIEGRNRITLSDVLVGEVWLCGGQSNMELQMYRTTGGREEIARSANPLIRVFKVKPKGAPAPLDNCEGHWVQAGPKTTHDFTAIGYYFAKAVQHKIHAPIGLLDDNYGGSCIEAWLSRGALDQSPDLRPTTDRLLDEAVSYPQRYRDFSAACKAWLARYGRQDRPPPNIQKYAAPAAPLADWKPVTLPGSLAQQGFPDSGVTWLRQTVNIAASAAGIYVNLNLGNLRDFTTVYWNGNQVGSTTADATDSTNAGFVSSNARRYVVPQNLVKPGPATVAIRLFSPGGDAGIEGAASAGGITLGSDWLARNEYALPPLTDEARASYPHEPLMPPAERSMPSYLYNGMIHPVEHYAIRGALWYQGEANVGRAAQYRTTFPLLINDWRNHWGEGEFPFYFCQLANFMAKKSTPGDSAWAEMREATTSVLSIPSTGQAVFIDLGEQDDIHFRDKKAAAERLALIALARTYARPISFSGPMYASMSIEGKKIRLHFKYADGGLVARPLPARYPLKSTFPTTVPLVRNSPHSELEGFAICGDDHKWVWADASIEKDTVVVSSDKISNPVAVRYAWADNPTCNLYNGDGLPACPFRTDDLPLTTKDNRY